MEFYIKQRVLTFFRSVYDIKDEGENNVFTVRSNVFIPLKLWIYDLDNQPLLLIKKRYFRVYPRFDIRSGDKKNLLAIVKAKISFFSKKFKIISKTPQLSNLSLKGDIIGLNFNIIDGDQVLGTINKKFISIGDAYHLKIYDEKNKDVYIAITIAIDAIVHSKKKKFRKS